MASSFPGGLDSFTNPTATDTLDSATVPHAAQHANANDAIEAIESTLGVNPQGSSATVVARLDGVDTTVAGKASTTHASTHGVAGSDPVAISATQVTAGTLPVARGGTGVTTSTGTVNNVLSASPTFTGVPTAPTAAVGTSNFQIASTAFVIGQASATTPAMDSTAAIGTSTRYARADHVHPSDTAKVDTTDSRLTDARTPTAHASTHGVAGSDPVTVASSQVTGLATSATTDTTNADNITSGTLPNARLVAVPNSSLANSSVTVNGSAISLGGSATVTAVPSGSAGGDLTGTYPDPTLVATGTAGTYTKVTTDAQGRVTSGTTLLVGSDISTTTTVQVAGLGIGTTAPATGISLVSGSKLVTRSSSTTAAINVGSTGAGDPSSLNGGDLWSIGTSSQELRYNKGSGGVKTVAWIDGSNWVAPTIINATTTVVPLTIRGAASQTATLQEWQNSASTVLWSVTAGGRLVGASATSGALFDIKTGGGVGASIQSSFSTQTSNLLQLLNSSSTVLGGSNAVAQIFTGSTTPITSTVGGATTAASGNGTTATLTMTSATNLAVGDIVVVAGVTPTGYNTTGSVVTAVSNSGTFTVSYANATTGSQTVAGTVSTPAQASVTARSAGTKGLVIRGDASQTANMMEFQNSAGSVIGYVNPAAVTRMEILQGGSGAETDLRRISGGGVMTMLRTTSAVANAGANYGRLYFRDGTTAGTLKLVVRAGTAGAETTIFDNIPTT